MIDQQKRSYTLGHEEWMGLRKFDNPDIQFLGDVENISQLYDRIAESLPASKAQRLDLRICKKEQIGVTHAARGTSTSVSCHSPRK